MEELDAFWKKLKTEKNAGLHEIPHEVWKTRKFDDNLLWLSNSIDKQKNHKGIDEGLQGIDEGLQEITKNCGGKNRSNKRKGFHRKKKQETENIPH